MIYNLTNVTLAGNIYELTKAVNTDVYGGIFAILVLVGIWIIAFTRHSETNAADAFFLACIITNVIGTFGWYFSGIVNFYVILVLNILTFGALIIQFTSNRFN